MGCGECRTRGAQHAPGSPYPQFRKREAGVRRTLDLQADRIEMVLASHRVQARVRGGRITPQSVKFELLTPLGTRVQKVSVLAEELALALGVPRVNVQRRGGHIEIEIPRQDRKPVPLERLVHRVGRVPRVTSLLGLDDEGVPLLLRLDSPDVAHVLVAGTTGSGKTVLMRILGLTLALWNRQAHVQLVLVDPKRRGLLPLAGLPHVWGGGVVYRPEEIVAMLERLVHLMESRDRTGRSWPRMVVLIDELAEVLAVGRRRATDAVTRLVQRGREAGLHVIAATQKPAASVLGGVMKGNFPVRVVGRVTSADDARVAAGLAGTGAEHLRGHGEFILVAGGEVIRFQAAYADGHMIRRMAEDIQARARAPRPATHKAPRRLSVSVA